MQKLKPQNGQLIQQSEKNLKTEDEDSMTTMLKPPTKQISCLLVTYPADMTNKFHDIV